MSGVVCTECGHRFAQRSQFEEECPECGEAALIEEDAYEVEVIRLRCAECGHEVDGAVPGTPLSDEAGRYTVEDPCPRCGERELVVRVAAPRTPRDAAELGLSLKVAERLLSGHWDGALPVDVDGLARAEGLEVVYSNFDHDGRLNDGVIEVPQSTRPVERFVIAHELGHHLLGHRVPNGKIEQEANAFASALLVPQAALRTAVEQGAGLAALCRRFEVSRQAMTYALDRTRLLGRVGTR